MDELYCGYFGVDVVASRLYETGEGDGFYAVAFSWTQFYCFDSFEVEDAGWLEVCKAV